jgi:hypothetical protein
MFHVSRLEAVLFSSLRLGFTGNCVRLPFDRWNEFFLSSARLFLEIPETEEEENELHFRIIFFCFVSFYARKIYDCGKFSRAHFRKASNRNLKNILFNFYFAHENSSVRSSLSLLEETSTYAAVELFISVLT